MNVISTSSCYLILLKNEELDKKYAGLLEKKWTSVIRLQKKVSTPMPGWSGLVSIRCRCKHLPCQCLSNIYILIILVVLYCFFVWFLFYYYFLFLKQPVYHDPHVTVSFQKVLSYISC